ncbi:MAG TPA: hypothetical protein VFI12_07350 [Thermomicrobiales bacterium]|jgi:hypothetical protein|nr:hypothetical protein [Thermomicrobiales bacterium]
MVLIIGLAMCFAPSVSAQQDAPLTFTIHLAECPAGYQGDDPFGDCHENRKAGISFQWSVAAPGAPEMVTTDSNGVAVIETIAAYGTLGISIIELPPHHLAGYSVYCSGYDGAEAVPVNYIDGEVGIAYSTRTPVSAAVTCDWYNIPIAAQGGDDTGNGGDQEPVTRLPSTGAGTLDVADLSALPAALITAGLIGTFAFGLRRRALR